MRLRPRIPKDRKLQVLRSPLFQLSAVSGRFMRAVSPFGPALNRKNLYEYPQTGWWAVLVADLSDAYSGCGKAASILRIFSINNFQYCVNWCIVPGRTFCS